MGFFFQKPRRTDEALLRDLSANVPRVRAAAVQELGRVNPQFPDLARLLEKALTDMNPAVRSVAMYSVLEQELETAMEDTLYGCLEDADARVREPAVIALVRLPDPKAADTVRKLVGDKDVAIRYQAVLTAAEKKLDDMVPVIAELLEKDPDPMVRSNAASALAELNPFDAGTLERAAGADKDDLVRFEAALALVRQKVPGSAKLLVPFLSRSDMTTDAVDALCGMPDESILPEVVRLYEKFWVSTQQKLQFGALLARLNDDRGKKYLLSKARSLSLENRIWALYSLGLTRADWAAEALREVIAQKPDSLEAETARDALDNFGD